MPFELFKHRDTIKDRGMELEFKEAKPKFTLRDLSYKNTDIKGIFR
jgi:hypothetical protein